MKKGITGTIVVTLLILAGCSKTDIGEPKPQAAQSSSTDVNDPKGDQNRAVLMSADPGYYTVTDPPGEDPSNPISSRQIDFYCPAPISNTWCSSIVMGEDNTALTTLVTDIAKGTVTVFFNDLSQPCYEVFPNIPSFNNHLSDLQSGVKTIWMPESDMLFIVDAGFDPAVDDWQTAPHYAQRIQ